MFLKFFPINFLCFFLLLVTRSRVKHLPGENHQTQHQLNDLGDAHRSCGEIKVSCWDGPGVPQGHCVCRCHQCHHDETVELEAHAHIF